MLERDRRRGHGHRSTDPRYYNIRWLELMHEIEPRIEQFGAVL